MESKAPSVGEVPLLTLYEDEDIRLTCEDAQGMPFIHCEVERYNKQIFKRLKEVWQEMEEAFRAHGHDEVYTYAREKPAKFAKMFGNPEVLEKIEHLGEEWEVIRWHLRSK